MRFSDWSSDVCSSDLPVAAMADGDVTGPAGRGRETHADQRRAGGVDAVGLGVHRNHARRTGFGYPAIKRRLLGYADIVVMVAGRVFRISEEPTSELQSLILLSYPVPCFTPKTH